ncbi:hypothetical protein PHYSODRAFT_308136 [Phytophthora sojae]|uniref:Uncharacterized protein n=1 Tax=Phytophthora sojae (strain P6497) TaxID=1094619 RepID=G5AIF5_PHYSP|nr:hypothetical protein PHYSODRAFT_308136 [Phytophthora sojae]EGZ04656.1 hypothetical protein PHYSODRAFT_308136 [Phytophthora sojae]|eukprot:XP_009539856.1 hypothetical protein PHYSODRAFT_308136 [Phytophthora sojae]
MVMVVVVVTYLTKLTDIVGAFALRGSNRAGGAGGGREQHILPHYLDLDLRVDTSSGRLPIAAVLGGVGRSTSCIQCLQTNAGRVRGSKRAGGAGGGGEQHILPHFQNLDLRVDTGSGRLPIAAVLGGVGRSTLHLDLRVDTGSGRLPIAAVLGGVGRSTLHLDLRVDTGSGRLPIAAVLGDVGRSTLHLDLRVDTSSGRLPIAAVLGGVGRSTSSMQCLQTNAGRVRGSNRAGGAGGGG